MDESIATTLLGKWDQRFQALACHISDWSKDPSTKVGAVLVDPQNRVISLGFNGFARGVEDAPELYKNRETKYRRVIHAERNALLFAERPLDRAILYTWPFMPCSTCASMFIQKNIDRVVSPAGGPARWRADMEEALRLFSEAGVKVVLTRTRV